MPNQKELSNTLINFNIDKEKMLLPLATIINNQNLSLQAESDDEQHFFVCKSNFDNDEEEDLFWDALDSFDFLTSYDKLEIDEMQKLEAPILPEKIWNTDNNSELLNQLIFSDLEKAFDALEFFKDEGYDANSDFELESDDEQHFFVCKSNFDNDEEEDLFWDALDSFDFLTSYDKLEIDEMQKLEAPILPEKIWNNNQCSNNNFNNYPKFTKSDNNILELLEELNFGKPEKAFDALEFFKDEGYDTNSDSELEGDREFVKINTSNFEVSKFKSLAM